MAVSASTASTTSQKILVIRRMKPLGFSLEQMGAAMRDIETLQDHGPASASGKAARDRLAGILRDARARRATLERQLSMADEFIDLLGRRI